MLARSERMEIIMIDIKNAIELEKADILKDIESLVNIPSVRDMGSKADKAPFGKEIRRVFDAFAKIAKAKGFAVEDFDGYAMHACTGDSDRYIGVLGHLDVVEAGNLNEWKRNPFRMEEHDGIVYGRGVNDDKGPMVAALYAAAILMEQKLPMKYPIRIIAGGAEETTWECMDHYFSLHQQPVCGFSPDGNFPIVNGEKGILQVCFAYPLADDEIHIYTKRRLNYVCDELIVEMPKTMNTAFIAHASEIEEKVDHICIVYRGTSALSRNPQRAENAIFGFVKDFIHCIEVSAEMKLLLMMLHEQFEDDFYGEKSGLYHEDQEMGTSSVCPMSINWNTETRELCLDVRYVKTKNKTILMQELTSIAKKYQAQLTLIQHKRLLFVETDSMLIHSLKKAYYKVMGEEAETFTKGGASYARTLDHGVAFGATFPDEIPLVHMPNEHMPITSLLKACAIYYEALYELAVDHEKMTSEDI